MGVLDDLIYGIRQLASAGTSFALRSGINFLAPFELTADSANDRTDVGLKFNIPILVENQTVPAADATGAQIVSASGALKVVGAAGSEYTLGPSGDTGWDRDVAYFEKTLLAAASLSSVSTYATTADDGEYIARVRMLARDTNGDVAFYDMQQLYKVRSSALTSVGSTTTIQSVEQDSSWNGALSYSGSNIVIQGLPDATYDTTFTGTIEVWHRHD